MKILRKAWQYLSSTTWGAWFFAAIVVFLVFAISTVYLNVYGTAGGNFIKDLQPLAVIAIGLASVYIALHNIWGKIGHRIICKFTYTASVKSRCSHMPYIKNIVLYNKKNKVEVIDKILLHSKNIGYTTLVDFDNNPHVLKNYETTLIDCNPVTAWIGGIDETDIMKRVSTTLFEDQESVITTIKEGTHPVFYVTQRDYLSTRRKISRMIAMTPNGSFPIQLDWATDNFNTVFPIRNTEFSSEAHESSATYEEEMMVYDASLIQVTELTLDESEKQEKPKRKEIKIIIHNHLESYSFIDPLEKEVLIGVSYSFSAPETENFKKQWEDYYSNRKEKIRAFVVDKFQRERKNIENYETEILDETQKALDDFFYKKISHLFLKKDLPKIASTIASKIIFLQEVKKFAQYPIIKKRHTLFATAFYPTESVHPCFEEMEESTFDKIRHWFHETLSSFTARGKKRKAQQSEKTKKPT